MLNNIDWILGARSIIFTNMMNGYILDYSLILETNDGGVTWSEVADNINDINSYEFRSFFFFDKNNGWLLNREGKIWQTSDGCQNWTLRKDAGWIQGLAFKIYFTDQNHGFALSAFGLLKTEDGGSTWIMDSTIGGSSICLDNNGVGFISGYEGGKIFKTIDGGKNWFIVDQRENNQYLSVKMTKNGYIWAVGLSGKIIKSSDMGLSWKELSQAATYEDLFSVSFIDSIIGWAFGLNTIVKTENGGNTWNKLESDIFSNINSVFFVNEIEGIGVSNSGDIIRTENGGITWELIHNYTGWDLTDVNFIDNLNGWICSSNGKILKTENGGISWNLIAELYNNLPYKILFLDQNLGFLVKNGEGFSSGGSIYKSINGGVEWNEVYYTESSSFIKSIKFINKNFGFAVGRSFVLKTTDSGNTWQRTEIGDYVFQDIDFVDENNGWIVAIDGIFLRTSDGGETWKFQNLAVSYSLRGLDFADKNRGWAVGDNGTILKTTNGGVTFIEDDNNLFVPNDFLLNQNYPNPFNPTTNIGFRIAEFGFVTLKVYDILGEEVATLVNGERSAGDYEVEFNGNDLSSGIYFYKLQTASYTSVKKMILMK